MREAVTSKTLVERLREGTEDCVLFNCSKLQREAADELERLQRKVLTLENHMVDVYNAQDRVASETEARQPDGYAYRYPTELGSVIRFSNGGPVNGARPSESIPYFFRTPEKTTVIDARIHQGNDLIVDGVELAKFVTVRITGTVSFGKKTDAPADEVHGWQCGNCNVINELTDTACAFCKRDRRSRPAVKADEGKPASQEQNDSVNPSFTNCTAKHDEMGFPPVGLV